MSTGPQGLSAHHLVTGQGQILGREVVVLDGGRYLGQGEHHPNMRRGRGA